MVVDLADWVVVEATVVVLVVVFAVVVVVVGAAVVVVVVEAEPPPQLGETRLAEIICGGVDLSENCICHCPLRTDPAC